VYLFYTPYAIRVFITSIIFTTKRYFH